MQKEIRFFLDTNLIVHYLILSNLRGRRKKELADRYKVSYNFIKKIINKKIKGCQFLASSLSRAEVYYVILNEYRCDKMYEKGIPVSCWEHEKWKEKLPEKVINEITNLIIKFSYEHIYSIGDEEKMILSVLDVYDPSIFTELVMKYNVRTHDAIIVSTAINEGCKYIITRDNRLKSGLKDKGYNKIELISPEEAIEKINNLT